MCICSDEVSLLCWLVGLFVLVVWVECGGTRGVSSLDLVVVRIISLIAYHLGSFLERRDLHSLVTELWFNAFFQTKSGSVLFVDGWCFSACQKLKYYPRSYLFGP